tara:strand:+ start:1082 stop:2794 length:1713 start_codon:yes stop_codon:yes gene_type:complete
MRKLLFSFFIFIQIHLPLNIFSQNSENDSTLLKFNNDTTISISIGDSIAVSNEIDTNYIEVKKIKEGNKNKIEIDEKLISFKIINLKVNDNENINIENSTIINNITINERDTLSMILQLESFSKDLIFNYYFNDNPNYRIIDNGKIVYDKSSKRIYFEFIPDNKQASNKFLTWNLFAHGKNLISQKFDFLIEINDLDYPPQIINKQIDRIIRDRYTFNHRPIINDNEENILYDLKTDAPVDNFNPINGEIIWNIDPKNIDELEKTYNFILKAYKKNNEDLFDLDSFKIIYSENNYPPIFGKVSKWVVEEGKTYNYKIPVEDPNVNDSISLENVGAQLPRGMKLDNVTKTLFFDVDYEHVKNANNSQNYRLELRASDLSGQSTQISLDVEVFNTINPKKVQEKITELIKEFEDQQAGLEEINDNLKFIEATSKNNRKIRTFSAAGITFLGAFLGVLSNNAEVTRKAGPIIGASGAVLSVINEVLSRDDNQIKNLLQETIKLQSNVMVKYERLSFYKNSQKISDFQNKEIDLLIRTIENEREGLNKNLFTISENYKIIISEKRIKKMLEKKI